jgi:Flp pilus assembly CpaE family ATPase
MLGLTLATRQPTALRGKQQSPFAAGALCLSRLPGPMLQIVGLCGGAGVSTLAFLIGAVAASHSSVPVLLCDTGGPTAGLAVYVGVESARTLCDAAELLAAGQRPAGGLWAQSPEGARVIAGVPQFKVEAEESSLRRLLGDARAAHGLSVIDGGTLSRHTDRVALGYATHVAWMMPGSESGLRRAQRVLARIAPLGRPELLIARAEPGERRAALHELADLADTRGAPLVLLPHIQDAASRSVGELAANSSVAIESIGALLRR